MVTMIVNDNSYHRDRQARHIPASQVPKRRESLQPSHFGTSIFNPSRNNMGQDTPGRSFSRLPIPEGRMDNNTRLAPPMDSECVPPPLSPHRPLSLADEAEPDDDEARQHSLGRIFNSSEKSPEKGHMRPTSVESMSWLDTINDSGGSTASSVHSRTSSLGVRRKHIRAASGDTEAEFDAALDAAVEAAYDEGFEPMDDQDPGPDAGDYDDEIVANVRRRVEQAKEKVWHSARETATKYALDRQKTRLRQEERKIYQDLDAEYDDNESEEEERMLDEMTRGYVMDDFEFGLQSKSALPRESDSSGFSGRTWNSSIGSNPTTAGTTLSTVTEGSVVPEMPSLMSKTTPPLHPPPMQALPLPPAAGVPEPSSVSASQTVNSLAALSVRSRRLSGQNPKQLKIETTSRVPPLPIGPLTMPPSQAPPTSIAPPPVTAGVNSQLALSVGGVPTRLPVPYSARQASSPFPGPSPSEIISPPTATYTRPSTKESENGMLPPRSGSPARALSRSGLRKNYSSSSLKNMKNRNLSISNADDGSDASPNTPLSNQFSGNSSHKDTLGRLPAMPTLPTPIASAFSEKMNGIPTGGLYLFDSDINSPETPGSPGPTKSGGPIPLEPCPNEFLLRPFWLMRALYQTIAHPRGGYLSTKLFVPRDVWRVKGVKIRNLEDKISNCDYLTAALQKLAHVDTCDADAVLEEMQALEGVLEQVQLNLTKKLGSEVGVQGSGILFRDAPAGGETDSSNSGMKTPGLAGKSSSFSWRRLRSKNSAVTLTNNHSSKTIASDGPKEGHTLSTLPMTSLANIRLAKRDVSSVQFTGPNGNYMGALARLFDAAQVIGNLRIHLCMYLS